MKIDDILINMDEETICETFLTKTFLEVIKISDDSILHPESLRDLVSSKISHTEMLRSHKMRNTLINSMKPVDAHNLAKYLGINIDRDDKIYDMLLKKSITKNSDGEKKLFEFFEEEWKEDIKIPKPDTESVIPTISLFDHQNDAVKSIKEYLDTGRHRVLLHMPTGSGKTRTAMRIISDYFLANESVTIIWLAYSEELCEQAIDEFRKTWSNVGNRNIDIYRFFGKHSADLLEKKLKDKFIVCGLSKIYNKAKTDSLVLSILADRVTLVVIDEAHKAVADTYKSVLEVLTEKHSDTRLLGLTATPGRTWNDPKTDLELSEFFDRKKVTLDVEGGPINFLIKNEYIVKPKMESLKLNSNLSSQDIENIKKAITNALDMPQKVLEKLANDIDRTLKIIDRIEKLVDEGNLRIIVFGSTIDHAKSIALLLSVRKYNASYIDGNTPKDVRTSIIDKFKNIDNEPKILCNFGVLTTGFDAPKISAVVIARPTTSLILYSQMIGRGIRGLKVKGTDACTVVTITDINLPGFNSMVDAFNNWEDIW